MILLLIFSWCSTSDNLEKFTDELTPLNSLPPGDDVSILKKDSQEGNFQVHSNPLFEFDDNFKSSTINPLFDEMEEDVKIENSNEPVLLQTPLSDKDECLDPRDEIDDFLAMEISMDYEEGYYDSEGDVLFLESLLCEDTTHNFASEVIPDHDTSISFSPRSDPLHHEFASELITLPSRIVREHEDYLNRMTLLSEISISRSQENVHANLSSIIENLPISLIPVEDSEPVQEEIDIFLVPDDLIPPGVENDDSEDEDNELPNLDHQNNPSSPRPPPEPPDVCLDFKPAMAMKNEDFNQGEIVLSLNVEDVNSFTFVIWTFLPFFTYPEDSPVILSLRSEDLIFDPSISTFHFSLKPPRDKNQRAFVRDSWSDSGEEDDEKIQEETCLVAQAPNEICLGNDLEPDEWIKDSGCSKHMTGNRKLFFTYKAINGFYSGYRNFLVVIFAVTSLAKDGKVIGDWLRIICVLIQSLASKELVRNLPKLRKIKESLNVTFDETPPPSKTSPLVDDDLDEEEAIREIKKKNLENAVEDETLEIDDIVNIKESRNHPLENNVNEALGDESWIVAMQEELNQFIANDVWELVPQPRNMTIIGTKWVFRNKLDENGIVSRNKARLVAQGYNQQEGIDYDETYAPVARLESIRILLAYACALDFKLFQMDVKSAFLNGFINEDRYMWPTTVDS
ncbi:retrovirus-related pol polyprotein from transposon TNT 1-94 [Tanacetum coccineum]